MPEEQIPLTPPPVIGPHGLVFRVITEEEWADLDALWAEEAKEEEQRRAWLAACTHEWYLYTDWPERDLVGPTIEIWCHSCHGRASEVYGECLDLICLEFDDVVISNGRHNLIDRIATVPVTISTWSGSSMTDYGMEHDWGIEVDTRGPAEYKEIDS